MDSGEREVSGRYRLKAKLLGCLKQLSVSRNEDPAARMARAPGHGGSKLKRVGSLQRKAINEALGLRARGVFR